MAKKLSTLSYLTGIKAAGANIEQSIQNTQPAVTPTTVQASEPVTEAVVAPVTEIKADVVVVSPEVSETIEERPPAPSEVIQQPLATTTNESSGLSLADFEKRFEKAKATERFEEVLRVSLSSKEIIDEIAATLGLSISDTTDRIIKYFLVDNKPYLSKIKQKKAKKSKF